MRDRLKKFARGFSLMELVFVFMVVTILAGIALLAYIQNMERARGAEAKDILYKAFASYKRMEADGRSCPSPSNCWGTMGLTDPNNETERYFNYAPVPNFNPLRAIRAERCVGTPCSAGATSNTSRWLQVNLTTGALTKSAEY